MNISPDLMMRARSPAADTEDLALSFVEEEVGRFDWVNNWQTLRKTADMRQRVQEWLSALRVEHSPDEIVSYLDRLVVERSGKWI